MAEIIRPLGSAGLVRKAYQVVGQFEGEETKFSFGAVQTATLNSETEEEAAKSYETGVPVEIDEETTSQTVNLTLSTLHYTPQMRGILYGDKSYKRYLSQAAGAVEKTIPEAECQVGAYVEIGLAADDIELQAGSTPLVEGVNYKVWASGAAGVSYVEFLTAPGDDVDVTATTSAIAATTKRQVLGLFANRGPTLSIDLLGVNNRGERELIRIWKWKPKASGDIPLIGGDAAFTATEIAGKCFADPSRNGLYGVENCQFGIVILLD